MSWKNDLDDLVRTNIKNENSENFGEMYNKIKVKEIMQCLESTVFKEVQSTVEEIYRKLDREGDKTAARELVTEMQRYSNFGYYFLFALQRLGLHELLASLSKNYGKLNPPNENSLKPAERIFFNEIFGFYRDQNPIMQLREPQADAIHSTKIAEPRKYEMPPNLTAEPPSYEESERKKAIETVPKTLFSSSDHLLNDKLSQNDLDTERSRDTTRGTTNYNIPPNKLASNSINSHATSFRTASYIENESRPQTIQRERELSPIRASEVQISSNSDLSAADLEISEDDSKKKCSENNGTEASLHGHYEEPADNSLKVVLDNQTGQKEFDNRIPTAFAVAIVIFGVLHYYKNKM